MVNFSANLVAVIAVTLCFVFISGLNDSSALVAAAISSRALVPRLGLFLAAAAAFVGFFVFGTAVATTIGKDLIHPTAITLTVLLVATTSASAWIVTAAYLGLPSSSTHALLGGLVGAVTMSSGYQALLPAGFGKVLIALFFAPIIGLIGSFVFMSVTQYVTRGAPPRINGFFKAFQPLNVTALALSYGANDGQKGVALIAMALAAGTPQTHFFVPVWVSVVCAATLAVGIGAGGWRTMRTLGRRIYKLRPVHAFAAQTASAVIVLGAALLGGPVSTPQVVSTGIMGVGSAERISSVHWSVARQIVLAWLLTIPASALLAAGLELVAAHFGL